MSFEVSFIPSDGFDLTVSIKQIGLGLAAAIRYDEGSLVHFKYVSGPPCTVCEQLKARLCYPAVLANMLIYKRDFK